MYLWDMYNIWKRQILLFWLRTFHRGTADSYEDGDSSLRIWATSVFHDGSSEATYPSEIISLWGLLRWVCSTMMAAFHCLPTRHPHVLRLLPAASAFASSVITITPVCQVRDSQVSKSFPLSLVLEAVQRVQGGRMPRERGRERSGETVQALTCTACIYLHCDCVYFHSVLHLTFSQCTFAGLYCVYLHNDLYCMYICTGQLQTSGLSLLLQVILSISDSLWD